MPTTLKDLAFHCENGACNIKGIINGLQEAKDDIPSGDLYKSRTDPASIYLKMVIMQIAYLLGEALGPSDETRDAYLALVKAGKEAR